MLENHQRNNPKTSPEGVPPPPPWVLQQENTFDGELWTYQKTPYKHYISKQA